MIDQSSTQNLLVTDDKTTNLDRETNATILDDLIDDISFYKYTWVLFKKAIPIGGMKMLQN